MHFNVAVVAAPGYCELLNGCARGWAVATGSIQVEADCTPGLRMAPHTHAPPFSMRPAPLTALEGECGVGEVEGGTKWRWGRGGMGGEEATV